MAPTTYQITADTMVAKHGQEEALRIARGFARKGDPFWRYVVDCIERAILEAQDDPNWVGSRWHY